MPPSLVAALLSALVFPGAGQLYLKRPARACLFLIPALLAVLYFLHGVMAIVSPMADRILAGSMAFDVAAISAEVERQGAASSPWLSLSCAVLVACWLASIVDAYLIGRAAP